MTKSKIKITGDLDFIVPTVVPSFIKGEDAEAIYKEVSKTIKSGIWFDEEAKTMRGSSTFAAARVDSILRPLGIRVATLRDLSRPEIMKMVRGKFYSDTPAIVFRSTKDGYEPNDLLIKQLSRLVEEKNGRLKLPVLITGFDVIPSEDERGYGLDIVARKDFNALNDKRLEGKYNEQRFSSIDENGLPNFKRDGARIWHAKDSGLSRLCLDKHGALCSRYYGDVNLAESEKDGRIIVIREIGWSRAK